jgi:two-component SAPR family response regulator
MTEKNGISIIIVDDDKGVRTSLKNIIDDYIEEHFSKEGLSRFQIFLMSNPSDAFNFISNFDVKIVFSDLNFKGDQINGESLLIETNKISPETKCVMVTASNQYAPPVELKLMGFIRKPVYLDKVYSILDRIIESFI